MLCCNFTVGPAHEGFPQTQTDRQLTHCWKTGEIGDDTIQGHIQVDELKRPAGINSDVCTRGYAAGPGGIERFFSGWGRKIATVHIDLLNLL